MLVAEGAGFGDDGDAVPASAAHDGARDAGNDTAVDLQAGGAKGLADLAEGFATGDDQGAGLGQRACQVVDLPGDVAGGGATGCAGHYRERRQRDPRGGEAPGDGVGGG